MGILGNLFGGNSEDGYSDFGSRLALAGQVLMAMDQGQVANIGPSVAALNERRRKIADEMQSKKWLQNQAAMMADKNPQLAQFLKDAPPGVGESLVSAYIKMLPEFQLPKLETFTVDGNVYRGNPNDPNAKPELWIPGPGPKPELKEIGGALYRIGPDSKPELMIPAPEDNFTKFLNSITPSMHGAEPAPGSAPQAPQPGAPAASPQTPQASALPEPMKILVDSFGIPDATPQEAMELFRAAKVGGAEQARAVATAIRERRGKSSYRPATPEEKAAIGLKPDAPVQIDEATNKAVVVSGNGVQVINEAPKVGNIPPGMQLIQDPATGGYRLEAIPGGPVAAEQDTAALKNERKAAQKQQAVDIVTQDIDRALTLLDNDSWMNPATGLGAGTMARFGGTNAANLVELTTTIASNISKEGMNQMRENSPTGAGMGTVSDADLAMLKTALGSVNNSQSEEQLRYNLNRLWNLYQDTIHGPNGGPPRRELTKPKTNEKTVDFNPNHVRMLKEDPSPDAMREFDEVYGPGAARRALGGQ